MMRPYWGCGKFEFSPKPQEVREGLEMVIINRAKERVTEDFIVETITVAGFMESRWWLETPLLEEGIPIEVRGTATETGGRSFNLYFLDEKNFGKWEAGLPFDAYFAGKGSPSYTFSFTIPPEKSNEPVYYVVERVGEAGFNAPELKVFIESEMTYEKPVDIEVSYRVEMTWEERIYGQAVAGLVMGGGLIALGVLLLIVALILWIIFKK